MSKSQVSSSSKLSETKGPKDNSSLRARWEFNRPLAYICLAVMLLSGATGYLLFERASNRLALSLKSKAELAASESAWDDEVKWLRRYLKLVPDSKETLIDIAFAANKAVELPPANRFDRVQVARQSLNKAVSVALNLETPHPRTQELQRLLILRLSQYGNRYAPEIVDKIIALNPPQTDSMMLRSFAIAMSNTGGQVSRDEDDNSAEGSETTNLWTKLLQLSTTQVLLKAWNANPSDIQLASYLLENLRAEPEQIISEKERESESKLAKDSKLARDEVVATVVADLVTRPDNGQAQWVLFTHQIATDPELATQRLASQFDARMSLLRKAYEALGSEASQDEQDKTSIPILPSAEPTDGSNPRWDYLLAVSSILNDLKSGSNSTPESQIRMLENLQELCTFSQLEVPTAAIVSIYSAYCKVLISEGDSKKVLQAFTEGIDRLGEESAQLQITRLSYLLNSGNLEEATRRLAELETLRKERAKLFTGAREALTKTQRSRNRTELDSIEWNLSLFRGLLAFQHQQFDQAIRILKLALTSEKEVPNNRRVTAAASLGQAYLRKQLWDLAANIFEQAIELAEDRDKYRIMAATAWGNSGNTEREIQLLNRLERRTLPLSIKALRSSIASELKKPPAKRNFAALQNRSDKISRELNALEDSNENKNKLLSDLELLALSIPEREDGDERDAASKRVLKLSDKYPDNLQILTTAALTMAASGNKEAADKLLQKLKTKLGIDSFLYAATAARAASLSGNPKDASDSLRSFANKNPSMARDALMLAAQIMTNQGEPKAVYDLLLTIPEDQRTIKAVYKLFETAIFLQQDAETGTEKYKPQFWSKRLRSLEGDDGTFWRLAEANTAIANSEVADAPEVEKLESLNRANDLYVEISRLRPNWAYKNTLGGWIAARRKDHGGAITLLRKGISAGDRRTSTLLLLVSELYKENRVAEAEMELNRLDQMVTANSVSTALAVSIAERKGDYERSMTLARRSAGDNPRGTDAWLLLAQTAMLAAKATDEKRARDILLAEAKEALDKALVNSKESNLSAYRLRIQFQASFFDEEGIRRELDRTLQSNVPEPSRSLFVGRTFLRLSDPKSALEVFERLRKITPDSPDVYLGLAEYYRNQRNDEQNIRMLEEALSRGLTRTDIRSRLALGLALRQTGSIPWQRIKDLVGEQDSSIGSNELLHALILINKGDDARKQRAAEILARIRESGQSNTDDATRMLAALETERWVLRRKEKASKEADISLARARELYIELTRRPKPSAMDLYKFGDLLLRADQTNELRKVANQLDRTAAGSAISLDLRLRLAKKSGDQEKADRLAEEWADRAIASGALLKSNAWGSVGQTLTRLGFHDEALEWLAKAYEADHRFYRDYVVGLARDQQYLLATDICKSELTDTSNPEALALMVDVMVLAGTGTTFPEENEKLIATATKQSQQVPRVIESIATLRLSQQRYVDAVRLYEQAEKLAPKNVRILNNLAMALSEIPGRETEAIPKIESAIAFFGRSPELLDTQGLVLLRNDMPVAATAVLREATAVSNDPRYRFHLIMALLENGDKKGAISNWAQLDLRQLSKLPLTPGELTDLESLKKTFESNT